MIRYDSPKRTAFEFDLALFVLLRLLVLAGEGAVHIVREVPKRLWGERGGQRGGESTHERTNETRCTNEQNR